MDFSGPEPADFANVERLNYAFLSYLRDRKRGASLREQLPAGTRPLVVGLTDLHVERLASAPFLLLSLRERDEKFWRVVTTPGANLDLFRSHPPRDRPGPFGAAALSFLWQLARRNPYAARLVSGASLAWCERLAECTLLDLLQWTATQDNWIRPRLAETAALWAKLLAGGVSAEPATRRAAHLSALQALLTNDPFAGHRTLRAAACRVAVPSLGIADKEQRR